MPESQIVLKTRSELQGVQQAITAFNALDATQQKVARDATTAAQNLAKVEAALKGPSQAADNLRQHLQNATAIDPKQAVSAFNQIIALENKASTQPVLPRSLEFFGTQAIDQFKSGLLSIAGPAAVATAALNTLKTAADLTVEGENINRVGRSFESLSRQAGTTGDAILGALRKASGGEISDLNLQLAVDKGLLLGVANSAQQFADIMTIARDRAAKMGITTTQAFDDITTGIGRESPRILDNLGIIVDEKAAHDAYARSIGKTTDELTKSERIEALRNAVIAQGKSTLDANVTAINDQTNSYARLGVALENAKNKTGSFLATATEGIAGNAATGLDRIFSGSAQDIADAEIAVTNFNRKLAGLPPLTAQAQAAQEGWTRAVVEWIAARERQLGLLDQPTQPTGKGGGGGGSFLLQEDITQQIALAQRVGAAFDDERQKLGQLQVALGTTEGAIQKSANASAVDAEKKDLQAVANQKVALETKNAADAFIKLNPNLDASQAFAAAAAAGLDPLVAQVIALRIEANKTRAELLGAANLANQTSVNQNIAANRSFRPSGREGGSDRQADQDAFNNSLIKQNNEQGKLLDSEIALAAAKGNTAREIELIRQKQAELDRSTTEGKAAYNELEAQIIRAREAGTRGGGKGLSATDRADVNLTNDLNEQLQILLDKQKGLKEGSLAWKQVQGQILDIQQKIADQQERARDAALDAQINAIEDRKKRREEANQLAGAQRRLASGEFTPEEKAAAQDVIDLIPLEQEKRRREIEKQAREGGIANPLAGVAPANLNTGGAATSPTTGPVPSPAQAGGASNLIIIDVDGKEIGRVAAKYLQNGRNAAALRG